MRTLISTLVTSYLGVLQQKYCADWPRAKPEIISTVFSAAAQEPIEQISPQMVQPRPQSQE